MLASPLGALLLGNVCQLVDVWCLPGDDTLSDLDTSTDDVAFVDCILCSRCLDSDAPNAGVVSRAVVCAIFKISHPGLESWRVVLLDCFAVGVDAGLAGHGCPFAGRVQECLDL